MGKLRCDPVESSKRVTHCSFRKGTKKMKAYFKHSTFAGRVLTLLHA